MIVKRGASLVPFTLFQASPPPFSGHRCAARWKDIAAKHSVL